MKIKVDYVTNSSSEVFGVVAGSSAIVSSLMIIIEALFRACKTDSDRDQTSLPQAQEVAAEAESYASSIASAALEDAKRQEQIVKDAYKDAEDTLDSAKAALEKELEETKKAWEDSEKTADKTDAGYENLKKQYDEYMEYLKNQIKQTEYQKQQVEYDKAQKMEAMNAKSDWVKHQQADYIAVKEEQAMLQAVAKGYNKPGYNTDAVRDRLEQLGQREKELSKTLSENDANISYTPKDRGEIWPSKESEALTEKIRAEKEAYEKAAKKASEEKKQQLKAEMDKNIEDYKAQIKRANQFDLATKAAEGVQAGADIAVEGLSYVTGPAGQKIKLGYKAGKAIASGMGEGMADPKNASKHLAKGILNASAEVIKDKFGDDKPWQAAATGILNEGLQGGLDAAIEGKDVTEAIGKGLTKGVVDAGTDKALDAIKGALPIPKGSSVNVGDYSVSKILGNNPLTKGIIKTTIREGAGSQIKDAVKSNIVDGVGESAGYGGD